MRHRLETVQDFKPEASRKRERKDLVMRLQEGVAIRLRILSFTSPDDTATCIDVHDDERLGHELVFLDGRLNCACQRVRSAAGAIWHDELDGL